MKKLLIIGILVLAFLFVFYIFRGCTRFVSSFDGEKKSKMIQLLGDYYYGKVDKQLWIREESTDSYKNVSNGSIDSLMWDSKHIIGYTQKMYFIVIVTENNFKLVNDKSSIEKIINKDYEKLREVPPLSFN